MYEFPPILQGNERQQIAALRDYLVRMVRNNNAESTQTAIQDAFYAVAQAASQESSAPQEQGAEARDLKDYAKQIGQLILKTADEITDVSARTDDLKTTIEEEYLAQSDFGDYKLQASLEMVNSATKVIEEFKLSEDVTLLDTIRNIGAQVDTLSGFRTLMNGQIRRGWITDPETDEVLFGIVISQSVRFESETPTKNDGYDYYPIAEHQTFGFYTSTGWQFWIDGQKRGWFDSEDGMLHVRNIVSENSFRLSAGWEMTASNGFGIKYVGG